MRDFDSIACVWVVVGMAARFVVFRVVTSLDVLLSMSPARARVVRRGFAGEVGLRGAMVWVLQLVEGLVVDLLQYRGTCIDCETHKLFRNVLLFGLEKKMGLSAGMKYL